MEMKMRFHQVLCKCFEVRSASTANEPQINSQNHRSQPRPSNKMLPHEANRKLGDKRATRCTTLMITMVVIGTNLNLIGCQTTTNNQTSPETTRHKQFDVNYQLPPNEQQQDLDSLAADRQQTSELNNLTLESQQEQAILADLVNQFFEKNHEAFKKRSSNRAEGDSPDGQEDDELQMIQAQNVPSGGATAVIDQQPSESSQERKHFIENNSIVSANLENPKSDGRQHQDKSQKTFMNLVESTTLSALESETSLVDSSSIRPNLSDASLVGDPKSKDEWDSDVDRHIQYDTTTTSTTTAATVAKPQGPAQNKTLEQGASAFTLQPIQRMAPPPTEPASPSEPTASLESTSTNNSRSSGVQARSMMSNRQLPPYATGNYNNQPNHRADANLAPPPRQANQQTFVEGFNQQPTEQSRLAPTIMMSQHQHQHQHQMKRTVSNPPSSNINNEDSTRSADLSVSRRDSSQPISLVDSLQKITSHLVDTNEDSLGSSSDELETRRTPNQKQTKTPTTTIQPPIDLQQHLQQQRAELERVAQKLTPSNGQLVVLEPIPFNGNAFDSAHYATGQAHHQQTVASPQVDPKQQLRGHQQLNANTNNHYQNDFYPAESTDNNYPFQFNHNAQQQQQQQQQQQNQKQQTDSQQNYYDLLFSLSNATTKTLEPTNPGEQQLTFGQANRPNNQSASAQLPINSRANGMPTGHYAASLINITAPIQTPLSASEAMEADAAAAADGHAKDRLFDSTSSTSGSSTRTPLPSNQHLYPTAANTHRLKQQQFLSSSPSNQVASYSQSANSFLPRNPSSTTAASLSKSSNNLLAPSTAPPTNYESMNEIMLSSTSLADTERRLEPIGMNSNLNSNNNKNSFVVMRSPMGVNMPPVVVASPSTQQASGFRSPHNQQHHHHQYHAYQAQPTSYPLNYLNSLTAGGAGVVAVAQTTQPPAISQQPPPSSPPLATSSNNKTQPAPTTNGFITSDLQSAAQQLTTNSSTGGGGGAIISAGGQVATTEAPPNNQIQGNSSSSSQGSSPWPTSSPSTSVIPSNSNNFGAASSLNNNNNRPKILNLTRVEHISAECSNDLIRTVIIFNGTFKGIIYSAGYVRDSNCLYINGTGKTRYDFNIKLNQCGTIGRQEIHPPSGPNEIRRRDQIMWNTLSIQYNPIIEQEWDEHFRVSCEYGSDFWKTISFNPFNVETNTGSPVVFTIDPPQCQMEVLKGHGMVGPRQEAVSGPVTVGDPLTLLIHMKSEKAGYDILVKNCVAHNGGQQKMQLIDSNGCVVNERFISPFRGTYNDNDLKHVTLYSYLKAFRFTGSPVLYLECEVHMCQSACPPQMCYWRRLSKRSTNLNETTELDTHAADHYYEAQHLPGDEFDLGHELSDGSNDGGRQSSEQTNQSNLKLLTTLNEHDRRRGRELNLDRNATTNGNKQLRKQPERKNLADKVSLFQALEVRQEPIRQNNAAKLYSPGENSELLADELLPSFLDTNQQRQQQHGNNDNNRHSLVCYRKAEVFGVFALIVSVVLASISVTVGCCLRATNLRSMARKKLFYCQNQSQNLISSSSGYSSSANSLICCNSPTAARAAQHLPRSPAMSSVGSCKSVGSIGSSGFSAANVASRNHQYKYAKR